MRSFICTIFILICTNLVFADTTVLNSFSAGELSPLLEGRTDTKAYYKGCRTFENFIVTSQGGTIKRPGTEYIAEVKDSNYPVRLIPFEYSTGDTYIIEAGEEYFRFYRNGGQILTGQGTEDISDVDDSVVAHWKLNDNESITTVIDETDNHNGTASEDTQELYYQYGNVNSCFDLGGNDAIDVNDSDELSFDDSGDNPFTFAGWVYVTDTGKQQTILSKYEDNGDAEYRLYLDWERKLNLELVDTGGGLNNYLVSQYYLNDDAASTAVADVTTNHDGVATANTDTLTTTGKINAAFDLDGQYAIEIADDDELTFNTAGQDQPFSVSAWIYLDSSNTGPVFSKYNLGGDSEYMIRISGSDNKLRVYLYNDGGGSIGSYSTESIPLNSWTHISVSYDGNEVAQGIKFYINGERSEQDYVSYPYSGMGNTDTNCVIGGSYLDGSISNFFAGRIDNVSVYCIELSPVQVKSIYNEGEGVEGIFASISKRTSDEPLQLGWRFAASTYDSTGGASAADGISLYADGAVIDSTAYNDSTYTSMQNTDVNLVIGAQFTDANLYENIWADKLDNIAIFADDLNSAEIASLYTETPYEISTTYDSNEIWNIKYIQSADKMYIAHPDHPVAELSRYGHTDWRLSDVDYQRGPFKEENSDKTIAIDPPDELSDICTSAMAISKNSNASDNDAFDDTIANNSGWVSTAATDEWIGQNFGSSKTIKRIRIYPVYCNGIYADTTPKHFSIDASSDGSTWVDIPINRWYGRCEGYLTGEAYVDNLVSYLNNIEVWLDNDEAYQYWRIYIDDNWGDTTNIRINEIEMFEADSGVFTSSKPLFNANHVGSIWKLRYPIETSDLKGSFAGSTTGFTTSIPIYGAWDFVTHAAWTGTVEVQKSYDYGATWITYRTFDSEEDFNPNLADEETEPDVWYRINCTVHSDGTAIKYNFSTREGTRSGVIRITGYIDPYTVTAEVVSELESRDATYKWSEGAWSADEGYPNAISLYEERFAAANTRGQPQTIWLSQTNDWDDFWVGDSDDDAMAWTLASDQVDAVRWLTPQSRLLIGTSGGEWTLSASAADEALSPTNVVAKRQSTNGCADIPAVALNNLVFFIQRPDRKIRSLRYSFEMDNWIAPDETVLSEHITESGLTQLALQKNPFPILWGIRSDGALVGMTFEDSQELVGWHRHTTDGQFESVARIPGTEEDEIWFTVLRSIDGNDLRYIERLKPFDWGTDQNDIWYVDCGLGFSISDTNTVSGADHLEGESVAVVGDGQYIEDVNVSGGVVAWSIDVNDGCIGLPYTARLLPMKLAVPQAPDQLVGQTKRLTKIVLRLHKSLDCLVGSSWTDYDEITDYLDSTTVYDANLVYSGDVEIEFDGDYETAGNIYIQSDEPEPLNVLALKAVFDKEE